MSRGMRRDVQLNWLARYRPIVKQLARMEGAVLEVGSGAVGIGLLYDGPFVGCDVTFERRTVPQMSAVIGSALHLPFADCEFGVVVASDVLEHIPANSRAMMVDQLIRVSRKWVIIGIPCGPASEWADHWLARWWAWWKRSPPPWLDEHQELGLPECEYVENLLGKRGGVTWTVLPNENIWMHLLFIISDSTRLEKTIRRVWRCWPGLVTWVADMAQWGIPYRRIYVVERVDGG